MFQKTDSLLLDALHGKNTSRPPIWLMRQAGRYLPSYQRLRARYSLLEMFHTPELIVEVTQLPLQVLSLDAAIVFADLLTVLDGLGRKWEFSEQGPIIDPVNATTRLSLTPAKEAYGYLETALRQLKSALTIPLLGFAGGPFTVASYLIEGKTSRDLLKTKQWLFTDPEGFHNLLSTITDATIDYLKLQIDAGVDALQLFDSWAHVLSVQDFRLFVLPYLNRIVQALKPQGIPFILFCRGSCFFAQELATLSPQAISLDWQGDIGIIRKHIPRTIALQGNLDPAVLLGTQDTIKKEADRILHRMRGDPGFIFNLGHGLHPTTSFENVQFLVEHVRNHS